MATNHVSELPRQQGLYGGLQQAEARTVLVDGDLSTLAAAKAAVTTDTDKLHIAEGPRIERQAHAALEMADNDLTSYTTGTDVSDYDALPAAAQYTGRQLR